jgi:hypothetical protein
MDSSPGVEASDGPDAALTSDGAPGVDAAVPRRDGGGASPSDGAPADHFTLTEAAPPTGQPGVWENVTPPGIDLNGADFGNDNYGMMDVVVDPARSSDLYTFTCHQGLWASKDYGSTWTGPINTGANGAMLDGKQWCGAIANSDSSKPPTLWTCNGNSTPGVWKSTDGGVSWTNYQTLPSNLGQDIYSLIVDPYDANHLLTGFHEKAGVAESMDGGETWKDVSNNLDSSGISYYPFFVDTGDAVGTHKTWLAIPEATGGQVGTWRTNDEGSTWARVESNEHDHGGAQIFQANQVVYMAGVYGSGGWGVHQSTDLGATWTYPTQPSTNESAVWGTPKHVYTLNAWACMGACATPSFEVADLPGAATWTAVATPSGLGNGAKRVAATYDGAHYVFVGGMWDAGIWRYVEP